MDRIEVIVRFVTCVCVVQENLCFIAKDTTHYNPELIHTAIVTMRSDFTVKTKPPRGCEKNRASRQ